MLTDTNIIFVFIVRMSHTPRVEVFLKVITYISVAQFTFDKKYVSISYGFYYAEMKNTEAL